jgi:hypothetical protein
MWSFIPAFWNSMTFSGRMFPVTAMIGTSRRVRQSSDVLGGRDAIDIGHLDVHQHQIIGSRLNGAVVPPARARGLRSVSHPAMSFHAV